MMRSSARLFQQAANLPKLVTKAETATTTYHLNTDTTITIKHKPIKTLDDLLMTMIGQPLMARLALAVAHQSVIPAKLEAIRDIYSVINPKGSNSAQDDQLEDFKALLAEFSSIRSQRIAEAYGYRPASNKM